MKHLKILILFIFIFCSCEKQSAVSGYTFTDDLNREVCVETCDRVATLLGSFADAWILAGGNVTASTEDAGEDFDIEDFVNLGGAHSPSLEILLSTNPDLVIASASTSADIEMMETLEALNIPVAYFDVDNFEDYLHMLDILTDITGRKDLYEKNGLEIKKEIDEVLKRDIPLEKRKILLLRASSSFVKAKGSKGTILGEMLFDLGCTNIADNNKNLLENLSVEEVIKEEPYHIFVVTMGDSDEGFETMIKENPAWSTLKAVRENRLHVMNKRLFNLKPNSQWGKSYEILFEALCK